MKYVITVIVAIVFIALPPISSANCPDGELAFKFDNLDVKTAFLALADFADLRPEIDPSIDHSGPINFDCTPWRTAANNIARKYRLSIKIENDVMYVHSLD